MLFITYFFMCDLKLGTSVTMNKPLTLIELIANLRFFNTEFYSYLRTKYVPLIVLL
jgi:hypothetical protein